MQLSSFCNLSCSRISPSLRRQVANPGRKKESPLLHFFCYFTSFRHIFIDCLLKHHMSITVQLLKMLGRQKKTTAVSVLQMGKLRHQMVMKHPNTRTDHQRWLQFFPAWCSNVPIAALSDTWEKWNQVMTV